MIKRLRSILLLKTDRKENAKKPQRPQRNCKSNLKETTNKLQRNFNQTTKKPQKNHQETAKKQQGNLKSIVANPTKTRQKDSYIFYDYV